MVDIGLLSAMSGLDIKSLLEENTMLEEFKGALTEQFVLQQLVAQKEMIIYYWSPEHARMEIDFLLQIGGEIVPLEVKAAENLKSKSLRTYYEKIEPKIAIRVSLSDFRQQDWMINVPLYAIHALPEFVRDTGI